MLNEVTPSVSFNEKASYISFTSPFLKNKKGHSRQITKSVKSIRNKENQLDMMQIYKYMEEIDTLLSRFNYYSQDYSAFLEARENFSEFSINVVFEKSEFFNKYNQDSISRILNNIIPIYDINKKYLYPSVLLAGVSAGGKTTTLRQIIGSINTGFPATMQANTTIGSNHIVVNAQSAKLIGVVRITNEAALKERIEYAMGDSIKKYLIEKDKYLVNNDMLIDMLFDSLTIFKDRKCKLDYIISKEELKSFEIAQIIDQVAEKLWSGFKSDRNKLDSTMEIHDVFRKNTPECMRDFDEYIIDELHDGLKNNEIMDFYGLLYGFIEKSVNKILSSMITFIFEKNDDNTTKQACSCNMTILTEDKKMNITDEKYIIEADMPIPKLVSLELEYNNGRSPDKKLKAFFFKTMEFFSSALESRRGKTLFPIIEEMRILGNFSPLWCNDSYDCSNFILVDSEGLGHDMKENSISMKLRTEISQCNKILFIQNGSEAINDKFADSLELLIETGSIYKTRFCFNRLEKFSITSNGSFESKIAFIKSGVANSLELIAANEEELLVGGKEFIFEQLIEKNSFYFEHLDMVVENDEFLIPNEQKNAYDFIEKKIAEDPSLIQHLQIALESIKVKINPETSVVKNLNNLIKSFSQRNVLTEEMVKDMKFRPYYRADKLSNTLNKALNDFTSRFISLLRSQPWQTVKAFNNRIAYDYDAREWRTLRPESLLIGLFQKYLTSYLLNPENLDNEKEIFDKITFTETLSQIISDYISEELRIISKKNIYDDMKFSCWIEGAKLNGSGSTWSRQELMIRKINEKFPVEYQNGNIFYVDIKKCIFKAPLMKVMKITYE